LFANALRKGIEETYQVESEAKWPNDIVVDWKKLAGILIETKISHPDLVYAIVGVGLNVNLTAENCQPKQPRFSWLAKKRFSLERTLGSILTILERHYGSLRDEGELWAIGGGTVPTERTCDNRNQQR